MSGGVDGMNQETRTAHSRIVDAAGVGRTGWTRGDCLVLDEVQGLSLGCLRDRIRAVAETAMRALSSPPDGLRTRAEAAPKCTVQQINELIQNVRSGEPPKLPEGNQEKRYYE
jgi:hypothetical protein